MVAIHFAADGTRFATVSLTMPQLQLSCWIGDATVQIAIVKPMTLGS